MIRCFNQILVEGRRIFVDVDVAIAEKRGKDLLLEMDVSVLGGESRMFVDVCGCACM